MDQGETRQTRRVIVTVAERGQAVLYGSVPRDMELRQGDPICLADARMILRWAKRGLLGLAAKGPVGATYLTYAVPSVTAGPIQEVIEVTPEAAAAIDAWPGHG